MSQGAIRAGHAFGYLATEELERDGTQLLIGFGPDAERCDPADLAGVQHDLEAILPGYLWRFRPKGQFQPAPSAASEPR